MIANDLAVVPSVGDEQDEPNRSEIARLRGALSLDGLQIVETSLGLDQDVTLRDRHHRIATSEIAYERHWNLSTPPQNVRDSRPHPAQQRELATIAHWIAIRMQGRGQLQPDHLSHPSDKVNRHRPRIAALQAPDRVRAYADLSRDLANAQA
jgi:hypothetical protein